jgi:polyphenol oxidase
MASEQFPGSFYGIAGTGNKIFAGRKPLENLAKHMGDQSRVDASRHTLAQKLGCDIQWLRQVHGVEVFDADRSQLQDPIADAAITGRANLAIAILTADCLPVMFADTHGRFVAGAHAGWRGLSNGVLDRTVQAFVDKGIKPQNIRAFFGPAIGATAFEVGDEVRQAFVDLASNNEKQATTSAFTEGASSAKWLANLCRLAAIRLARFGVLIEHQALSEGASFCTYSNPKDYFSYRYFSHHPQVLDGRQATLIWRAQ